MNTPRQPLATFWRTAGPAIAAPLIWQEKRFGAIVAANPHDHSPFTPDDLRPLDSVYRPGSSGDAKYAKDSSNRNVSNSDKLYHSTQALLGAGREEDLIGAVSSNMSEGNTAVAIVKGIQRPSPALVVVGVNDAQWEANRC